MKCFITLYISLIHDNLIHKYRTYVYLIRFICLFNGEFNHLLTDENTVSRYIIYFDSGTADLIERSIT